MTEATRVRNNPDLELLSVCRERCVHQDYYGIIGVSIAICCESELVAGWIRPFLATFRRSSSDNDAPQAAFYVLGDGRQGYLVVNATGRSVESPSWHAAFSYLFSMMHAQIWSASAHILPLHSAAVSIEGEGLLLPGDSGQGKSTLALELAAHGCAYLSDEFAPIYLPTARVLPFPRPLQISSEAASLLLGGRAPGLLGVAFADDEGAERRLLDPRGTLPLGEAAQVRHIAFLDGFAQAGSLARLSKAEALVRLSASTIVYHSGAAWKRAALEALTTLVANAGCWTLKLGPIGANYAVLKELARGTPKTTASSEVDELEELRRLASRIAALLGQTSPLTPTPSRRTVGKG